MSGQRVEIQHNEPEQVEHYLEVALDLLERKVAAELRSPELLTKLLDLLSSKTITQVQAAPIGVPLGMPMPMPRGPGH